MCVYLDESLATWNQFDDASALHTTYVNVTVEQNQVYSSACEPSLKNQSADFNTFQPKEILIDHEPSSISKTNAVTIECEPMLPATASPKVNDTCAHESTAREALLGSESLKKVLSSQSNTTSSPVFLFPQSTNQNSVTATLKCNSFSLANKAMPRMNQVMNTIFDCCAITNKRYHDLGK